VLYQEKAALWVPACAGMTNYCGVAGRGARFCYHSRKNGKPASDSLGVSLQ
jgi:hypothetical protein